MGLEYPGSYYVVELRQQVRQLKPKFENCETSRNIKCPG